MSEIGWVSKPVKEDVDDVISSNASSSSSSHDTKEKRDFKVQKEERKGNFIKKRRLNHNNGNGAHEKEMVVPGVCIESLINENVEIKSKFYTKLTIENSTCNDVSVAIYGRADMKVIKGSIEIMGYTCRPDSLGGSLLRINSPSKAEDGWMHPTLTIQSRKEDGIRSDIEVIFYSVSSGDEIVNTRSFQIIPTSVPKGLLKLPPSWSAAGNVICDEYKKYVSSPLGAHNGNVKNGARVLICGAKGVGKSTCLRYVVNRLLSVQVDASMNENVYILDCDVGQPECSPPGMLTLTRLSKPLTAPPYTSMVCGNNVESCAETHENAYFFGDITSKSSPFQFTAAISNLMQTYNAVEVEDCDKSTCISHPLVVNTDGWVKGLGYELLSAIIDIVDPHYIIQIRGSTKAKSFDLSNMVAKGREILYIESVGTTKMFLNTNIERDVTNASEQAPSNYISSKVSSCAPSPVISRVCSLNDLNGQSSENNTYLIDESNLLGKTIASSDLRTVRICTYFLGGSVKFRQQHGVKIQQSGISDKDRSIARCLASMKPYIVPFDAVECHILEENFDIDMTLAAMNGSIVGLCYKSDSQSSVLREDSISLNRCVGLGIIRSIDAINRIFYILSPVPREQLSGVNLLVKGRLHVPLECIYQGPYSQFFPYQTCDGHPSGTGSARLKSRNNPTRKMD